MLATLWQHAGTWLNAAGAVTVTVSSDQTERMAKVSVQNRGATSESSHPRGLDLGQVLVQGLVDLHGGTLETSGTSPGASLTIRLPLATQPAAIPAGSENPANPRTLRILIIDDQRDASYPLRKLLEMDGHSVQVAVDGPSGIRAASRMQPQVVLCDIGLPGPMNGFEVAQALRRDPQVANALLVAVTGYGQEEDRRQCTAAGFDRHLTKPVGQSELRSLLSDLPPTFARDVS
jgi:CheY-like chemotaxis protein